MRTYALGLLVLAALVGGCGQKSGPRVAGGGATFVDPIMQKWAAEYKAAKNVTIDYVAQGSGYGISQMTARTIDFGCSDAPMNEKELKAAKDAGGDVIHVPVAVGAVAVIYNLDGIDKLTLNGEVLADIYLGKITKWNHADIKKLNEGVALPDQDITAVARAESSGTTNIFTEYLGKRSPAFAANPGASKLPKWPGKVMGKQGNDGVAEQVKNAPGTIGYVELAYAKKNNIRFATLINKAGKPVAPDADSVTAAVEAAMKATQDKQPPYALHPLAFSFTDAEGEKSYPIVGASYAMLFQKQPRDKGPALVEFLRWVVADGQQYAKELDYAPLPTDLTMRAQELLGTVTFE